MKGGISMSRALWPGGWGWRWGGEYRKRNGAEESLKGKIRKYEEGRFCCGITDYKLCRKGKLAKVTNMRLNSMWPVETNTYCISVHEARIGLHFLYKCVPDCAGVPSARNCSPTCSGARKSQKIWTMIRFFCQLIIITQNSIDTARCYCTCIWCWINEYE